MSGVLRPKFPGRVFQTRSSTGTRRRLRTAVLELGTDTTRVGENVARGIRAFYTMLGSESDDEMEPCHGFVDGEMRQAELRRAWLGVRAGQCREQLWAGQGVALDPGERELILRHPEDNGKDPLPVTQEANSVDLSIEKQRFSKKNKESVKKVTSNKSKNLVQSLVDNGLCKVKSVLSNTHSKQNKWKRSKHKKIKKTIMAEADSFHGFTDSEIESASLKSGRSSISGRTHSKYVPKIRGKSKKQKIAALKKEFDANGFQGFTDDEIETASLKSGTSSILSGRSKGSTSSRGSKTNKNSIKTSDYTVTTQVKELRKEPVISGKRKWKPSQRAKDNNETLNSKVSLGSPKSKSEESTKVRLKIPKKEKKNVTKSFKECDPKVDLESSAKFYANAVSSGNENKSVENILKSQSKGRKQSEKTKRPDKSEIIVSRKIVLKESILAVKSQPEPSPIQPRHYQIDETLLRKILKLGKEKFAEKAQKFLLGTGKISSFVKDNDQNLVDVIGCALVDKTVTIKTKKFEGNIICGVCGYILYCRDVRKFRRFGVFLCSHCQEFGCKFSKNPSINLNNESEKEVSIMPWSDSNTNDEKIWTSLLLRSGCKLVGVLSERRSSGKILECIGSVSAALPVFEKVKESDSDSLSSASITSSELLSLDKTPLRLSEDGGQVSSGLRVRSVLHESLAAPGWTKKAVRRRHGTWQVFLLSPDHRILRSVRELKIYVAKTGAIIDSNIINFSLPQVTGAMESELTTLGGKSEAEDDKESSRSRRSVKMPSKFSDFTPNKGSIFKKREPESAASPPTSAQSPPVKVHEPRPDEGAGIKVRSAGASLPPLQVGATKLGRWETGVHVCPVCDKDCGFKQNLYFHLKKHEEDPDTPMTSEDIPTSDPVKRGRGRPRKIREDSVDSSSGVKPVTIRSERASIETPLLQTKMEAAQEVSQASGGQTRWRNGVPPPYWVWGRYICEVCKKDCGYMNNLGLHRKRTHGLSHRQERLGYNGEIVRGTKIDKSRQSADRHSLDGQVPVRTIIIKRKLSMEASSVTPGTGKKFISKAMPCFECTACKNDDCMNCKWCHDKKKYGGPGRLNKRCITRRCTNPRIVETVDHLASRPRPPVKLVRLETREGGQVVVQTLTPAPVRTQYLSGGLVKAMPCRQCEACLREDCGHCKACLDKRKFGGPGKMNKRCRLKQCITPKELGDPSTVPTTYVRRQPGFVSSKFTQEDVNYILNGEMDIEEDEEGVRVPGEIVEAPNTKESLENFVEMGLDIDNEGNFTQDLSLNEFELPKSPVKSVRKTEALTGVKTVPVPDIENLPASKYNVAVEFWQPGDREDVQLTGTGLITAEAGADLCFVCASSGLGPEDSLVYCGGCCQSYHKYCVPGHGAGQAGEAGAWRCGLCVRCKVCGGVASEEASSRSCGECHQMYHHTCLPLSLRDSSDSWKCGRCRDCDSCGVSVVTGDSLCPGCTTARAQGSYCPLCQGGYSEEDYDSPMMECSVCGGWIHAQCEGIDGEEYQVLSYLPDTVSYVCKCKVPAPKAKKSRGMKKTVLMKTEEPSLTVKPAAGASVESGLDVAALVPVPILVTNSPLRDNSLHSLNPVPAPVNYNFEETLRKISFDLPIAPETNQDDNTEPADREDGVVTSSLSVGGPQCDPTSPKASEAIDDECDDTEEYVTLDTSVLALPSSIDTSWAAFPQN